MNRNGFSFLAAILGCVGWGAFHAQATVVTNINIVDFAFSPAAVTVSVNDQVSWRRAGAAPHSSTSDTGLWDSGVLGAGSSFTNAFLIAGTYPYHCTVHPFMTATITVLAVSNGFPVILTQPQSQAVSPGQNATFSVTATGPPPLTYQWRFQGTNISGATGSAFTSTNAQSADAGPYSVIISNSAGSVTSANAILTVAPTAVMTVLIAGQGSVFPNYNGQMLVLGSNYSMTATPAAGFAFVNWTGGQPSSSATIDFVMHTNLVLEANFATALFVPIKATYLGLFSDTNGVALGSAGGFRLTTTAKGSGFSGNLQTVARRYPFSGSFSPDGTATVSVGSRAASPLTLYLQLNLSAGADGITGTLSDGQFVSQLFGARAVFDKRTNQFAQAGKYTMVIPGVTSDAGDGFGAVNIDAAGRIKLRGALADGTKITQSTSISSEGLWPLFVPLRGSGLVLSWVALASTSSNDLSGALTWIPAPRPSPTVSHPVNSYAAVSITETEVEGSAYQAPARGTPALNLTAANLVFAGGGLTTGVTNAVTLGANNQIRSEGLRLSINSTTGILTGTTVLPTASGGVRFLGIVEQKHNLARGYFFGTAQNGSVRLEAP